MTSIRQASTVLKGHRKQVEKLRWTSSWTNCLPRPSGHIGLLLRICRCGHNMQMNYHVNYSPTFFRVRCPTATVRFT